MASHLPSNSAPAAREGCATPIDAGADSDAAVAQELPPRLILFDGHCGLCDRSLAWIIERDGARAFHFAPLQGETAAALRHAHPGEFPTHIDTVVFVDSTGPVVRILLRSRAAFAIVEALGLHSLGLSIVRHLPRWLTDLAYRGIAISRFTFFGKLDACIAPSPAERARFLD